MVSASIIVKRADKRDTVIRIWRLPISRLSGTEDIIVVPE